MRTKYTATSDYIPDPPIQAFYLTTYQRHCLQCSSYRASELLQAASSCEEAVAAGSNILKQLVLYDILNHGGYVLLSAINYMFQALVIVLFHVRRKAAMC